MHLSHVVGCCDTPAVRWPCLSKPPLAAGEAHGNKEASAATGAKSGHALGISHGKADSNQWSETSTPVGIPGGDAVGHHSAGTHALHRLQTPPSEDQGALARMALMNLTQGEEPGEDSA